MLRSIDVAAHAGTAFDGQHLFQIAEDRIQKIDPKTGRVLADPGARRRRRLGARVGRRDTLGGAVSGPEDPSESIRRQGRFFAPSSPTASSPGSPGSTASSGTPPGKATRATCGESILERERSWRGSNAAWSRRVGARVRWRRSVLLRRRKGWEVRAVRRPSRGLRGGQRLRDPRRLHKQGCGPRAAGR